MSLNVPLDTALFLTGLFICSSCGLCIVLLWLLHWPPPPSRTFYLKHGLVGLCLLVAGLIL